MSLLFLLQTDGNLTQKIFIFSIVIVLIIFRIKNHRKNSFIRNNYEQHIINTVSTINLIDPELVEGRSPENMKADIRREILKINNEQGRTFLNLEKMNVLMDQMELENLQKLYQWFFSLKTND